MNESNEYDDVRKVYVSEVGFFIIVKEEWRHTPGSLNMNDSWRIDSRWDSEKEADARKEFLKRSRALGKSGVTVEGVDMDWAEEISSPIDPGPIETKPLLEKVDTDEVKQVLGWNDCE